MPLMSKLFRPVTKGINMRNAELSCSIRSILPDFERRYDLLSSSYSAQAFGNSKATYSDSVVEILFCRDRGELTCDVRLSGSEKWISLCKIYPSIGSSLRPESEPNFLRNCLEHLVNDYELMISSLRAE